MARKRTAEISLSSPRKRVKKNGLYDTHSVINRNIKPLVSSSELDLCTPLPIDPTILETYQVHYRPLSTYTTGSDFTFKVKGDAEDYVKLSETSLTFGIQFMQADGVTPINEFQSVGPINNTGQSAIDKIDVTLNNQSVSSSNKYSQRSYISNLLNYGPDAIESHLMNTMFVKDTTGSMDKTLNDVELPNQGLRKRSEYFENGKIHYFNIHLDCDIFNVDKLLPNLVDMQVTITPSKPEYFLIAGKQQIPAVVTEANKATLKILKTAIYHANSNVENLTAALEADPDNIEKQQALARGKLELERARAAHENQKEEYAGAKDQEPDFTFRIIDPVLWVTKVKLLPSVAIGLGKALEITPAKLPITRVGTKQFAINQGEQTHSIDNAVLGQLPKRMLYFLTDMESYSGNYGKNPFNYQHFNLQQTSTLVNGKAIPLVPFRPDFNTENYCREYQHLFNALGIYHGNAGICITKKDYRDGFTIFGHDLTQNKSASDSSHGNIIKQGDIRIDLQFKQPLPTSIICLVVSEYDNVIEIDRDRNVYLDYNPV